MKRWREEKISEIFRLECCGTVRVGSLSKGLVFGFGPLGCNLDKNQDANRFESIISFDQEESRFKYNSSAVTVCSSSPPNQSIIKAKKMSEKKERRILVAVDEGEESIHALSWCLSNLVQPNSDDTLVLLYSKPPRPVYSAIDGPGGS